MSCGKILTMFLIASILSCPSMRILEIKNVYVSGGWCAVQCPVGRGQIGGVNHTFHAVRNRYIASHSTESRSGEAKRRAFGKTARAIRR